MDFMQMLMAALQPQGGIGGRGQIQPGHYQLPASMASMLMRSLQGQGTQQPNGSFLSPQMRFPGNMNAQVQMQAPQAHVQSQAIQTQPMGGYAAATQRPMQMALSNPQAMGFMQQGPMPGVQKPGSMFAPQQMMGSQKIGTGWGTY